jgi:large subunit ribosomal protein L31
MKKDIHPADYRPVVFQDLNNNHQYITKSTVVTPDEVTIAGTTYPLVKVHISAASHPFFTGQEKLVDIEGRVDKFAAKRAAAEKAQEARAKAAAKVRAKKVDADTQKLGR